MDASQVIAKLVTIEKLLIILASNPKFESLLRDAEAEIDQDYGQELNRMFLSDPGYSNLNEIVRNFREARQSIDLKIEFLGIDDA